MSTTTINNRSQQINARFPHEVVTEMENLLVSSETRAQFIVTAVKREISRRQLSESGEVRLLSRLDAALQALAKIEEIGERAGTDIRAIVDIAHAELEARQRKKPKDNPDQ
ncbi:hypothetical protein F7758_02090 [Salmonella enterica subsp. enterica]|uniref:Uncharacterized protein n=1 Tax=Salmonella enterica TaxID=28901 RepID=A0A744IG87_SALER|nr:hypothetical protein [Salmonella enterica subsp. enterica serovar Miami]EHE9159621.1 hypothetical protein [Salmonella enterica]HAF2500822.1 hypothetical protein [Salmonella enterica]HAF6187507.1 hypothetical protein [Salmonella enterica]HDC2636470.1 hypothetical protein [Salmonella enterica]